MHLHPPTSVQVSADPLTPSPGTTQPDGTPYDPITVRVVASVYPYEEGKKQRGQLIDGFQVELFAALAPADAWPAPDIVAQFFARAAQENRFAQEDRELGLDRIVSYHLPGQELASVVALSLWNLQVIEGFLLAPPDRKIPQHLPRHTSHDERIPQQWPRDPVLKRLLNELDWEDLLAKKGGWTWDSSLGELRCEDGRELHLTTLRKQEHSEGRTGVIFRRPQGGCEGCSHRPGCHRTSKLSTPKHAEFSIATKVAHKLRRRLAQLRGKSGATKSAHVTPIEGSPGPHEVAQSLFLPAAARQLFAQLFEQATFHIKLALPPPPKPQIKLVADDIAERQRRRKTWAQNLERYALPQDADFHITISAAPDLQRWLNSSSHPQARAA